ncbi:MAG: hypothetical protein ACF8XB_14100 [Planctomycetota bacterium JB042]
MSEEKRPKRKMRQDVRAEFERVADEIADTIVSPAGETRSAYALMRLSRALSRQWATLYNGNVDRRVLSALKTALSDLPVPAEEDDDGEEET